MKFLKLLDPWETAGAGAESVVLQQRLASLRFRELVEKSPLRYWCPVDSIYTRGKRLLIGVAAGYHLPSLRLLDLVAEKITTEKKTDVRVDVFELLDLTSLSDAEKYFFGGLQNVGSTPIVGEWQDGVHQKTLESHAAMKFLLEEFGISQTVKELFDSVHPPSREMLEDSVI